ncbi:hypothetical protein CYY_003054 [Polysphondylium violaceum]|uniref:BP74 N-terminal domain-containing protein n=1 Tax=Polysphondylium violaceum TaxID=133409 RepID=A0A8J4UUL7_9MYCE|nr:hypothetical protein CYY_003054 [Polysphondylium violaceum]
MKNYTFVLLLLLLSLLCVCFAETAYFAVKPAHYDRDEFIIQLHDDRKISEARKILSGDTTGATHVMGRIRKVQKSYNPKYDYHLDPETISFFEMAIEVCDSSATYLNDHLDEACGAFLPGCFWCPWGSSLVRELKDKAY